MSHLRCDLSRTYGKPAAARSFRAGSYITQVTDIRTGLPHVTLDHAGALAAWNDDRAETARTFLDMSYVRRAHQMMRWTARGEATSANEFTFTGEGK